MALGPIAMLGADFLDLIEDQAEWSQKTFGADGERGPVGALRHLSKEAGEAEAAWCERLAVGEEAMPKVREELADCLLLIIDAARRCRVKPLDLIHAAQAKMKVNKARMWPKPETDTPVEHVR